LARINWAGPSRCVRLSTAAISLLKRLGEDGMRIEWAQREGQFFLWNGSRGGRVSDRTVQALVACGVLQRAHDATEATYIISPAGQRWLDVNV